MKVTLGGDRLGAGRRQKVEMREYGRSNHDLSRIMRTTMSFGTLVPFMHEMILPGDTFDIDLQAILKTLPTNGPLFGNAKFQLDLFEAPMRLYNAILHNNTLEVGNDMSKVHLPQMRLIAKAIPEGQENIDNAQINPSCLLSYLGIRGVGYTTTDTTRDFTALKLLAYWDIYKNYYANKQEEIGAVIHAGGIFTPVLDMAVNGNAVAQDGSTPQPATFGSVFTMNYAGVDEPQPLDILITFDGFPEMNMSNVIENITYGGGTMTGTYMWQDLGDRIVNSWRMREATDITEVAPQVATFPLKNLDDMRKAILQFWDETAPFVIGVNATMPPYQWLIDDNTEIPNMMNTQEGLAIKTYNSDLFNNWLRTEWIDAINTRTSIDASAGTIEVNALIIATKVYKMLNRVAMAGGSYNDWINAVYTHEGFRNCESPMYHGSLIKEVIFQEVVSNSASDANENKQPLGTLGGRGTFGDKHKGGKIRIRANEPGYIIGIASITPRIDYSQGTKWDSNLETMEDLHVPQLDEIGFQELITQQMAWWDTQNVAGEWVTHSAGKQTCWINYQTAVNEVLGDFAIADNSMFMVLNRRYEFDESLSGSKIGDLTTYIDPAKFNFIFADASLTAQNFWVQIGYDLFARRVMSDKVMPNL